MCFPLFRFVFPFREDAERYRYRGELALLVELQPLDEFYWFFTGRGVVVNIGKLLTFKLNVDGDFTCFAAEEEVTIFFATFFKALFLEERYGLFVWGSTAIICYKGGSNLYYAAVQFSIYNIVLSVGVKLLLCERLENERKPLGRYRPLFFRTYTFFPMPLPLLYLW